MSARNIVCAAPDTGSFELPGLLEIAGAFLTVQTVIRKGDAELIIVLEKGELLK